jgi:hypothetical protein
VIFNVNGEKVHKSDIIKKTLNPKWSNEKFTVNIVSDLSFLRKSMLTIKVFFFFSNRELLPVLESRYLIGIKYKEMILSVSECVIVNRKQQ